MLLISHIAAVLLRIMTVLILSLPLVLHRAMLIARARVVCPARATRLDTFPKAGRREVDYGDAFPTVPIGTLLTLPLHDPRAALHSTLLLPLVIVISDFLREALGGRGRHDDRSSLVGDTLRTAFKSVAGEVIARATGKRDKVWCRLSALRTCSGLGIPRQLCVSRSSTDFPL
jgi:hypothetical protein